MANDLTPNPFYIDTTGATSLIVDPFFCNGIIVIASADTWSVVCHDAAGGKEIFRVDSNIVNHRSSAWTPPRPQFFKGFYATTLTNINHLLVYKT